MKKRFLFVMATVLVLSMSIVTIITGCGCSDNTATPDEATVSTKIETVTEIATDEQGNTYVEEATEIVELKTDSKSDEKSENEKSENSKTDDTDDKKGSSSSKSDSSSKTSENSSDKSESSNSSNKKSNSSSSSSSSKSNATSKSNSSSNSKTSSSSNNSSSSSKTWHEAVTEQVWVVDQEAYAYEEPVYEYKVRTICNDCGADITGNALAHSKSHALNGENGSYRAEKVQIQTGTKTVEVPEQGHWETKVIKEAGYY